MRVRVGLGVRLRVRVRVRVREEDWDEGELKVGDWVACTCAHMYICAGLSLALRILAPCTMGWRW